MKNSNMNKVVVKSIISLLTLLLLLTSNITVYAELNKLEHKSSLFLKATVKDGELLFLMDDEPIEGNTLIIHDNDASMIIFNFQETVHEFENKVIAFGYHDAAGYLIGGAPHEQFSMGFTNNLDTSYVVVISTKNRKTGEEKLFCFYIDHTQSE